MPPVPQPLDAPLSEATFGVPGPQAWADERERRELERQRAQEPDSRAIGRHLIHSAVDAYARLFVAVCTPEAIERFVRHRIRVVLGEYDGSPLNTSGVMFWERGMDVPDDQLERAYTIARDLGHEFAQSTHTRLCDIPIKTLIDSYAWLNSGNPLYASVPQAFETACRAPAEAICKKIIHGCLLASQRPIIGSYTRAGAWQAHLLIDACRWPSGGFGEVLKARAQVIDTTSRVSDRWWRAAALESDKTALADLRDRLKGGVS
jgi:hypothetical protein